MFEGKQSFYDELKCEVDVHSADDLVMFLGDINGHVRRHIYGSDWVHGGYCIGQSNLEGTMLLECCQQKELSASNARLRREEKRKVTFRMGENETEIDFMLIKNEH